MSERGNIVPFPFGADSEPIDLDQIVERLGSVRESFASMAAEAVTSCVIQSVISAGYPVDEYEHGREIALVQEAIKSMMMKTRGLEHPLQHTAEEMFDLISPEEYWGEEIES